jgi:hypothetical protein
MEGTAIMSLFKVLCKPQVIFSCSFHIPTNVGKQPVSANSCISSSLPNCHCDNKKSKSVFSPWAGFWQEPEPSQATGMVLARCILGKFLGVVFYCFSLPLDVPTFATYLKARALLVAKDGNVGENGVR